MNKQARILILGAGKSASVLIQYLQKQATLNDWYIILADGDKQLAEKKWNNAQNGHAIGFNIENTEERKKNIQDAAIVVSMLPAFLHILVAKDCVLQNKPLFTASYVDENMKALETEIKAKNLLFLCEMGLDPGIDHMSAMELIHRIQKKGGKITGFKSHCGGLVAPENDNNPWHYKISWNPRNIILAGKAGAIFLEDGKTKQIHYDTLFSEAPKLQILGYGQLSYYPNRNSLSYIDTYQLQGVTNFVRTTLRDTQFCSGWDAIIKLGLTSENIIENNAQLNVKQWFNEHIQNNHLQDVYSSIMSNELQHQQFHFLGLDEETLIPLTFNTNAQILQWILENKWKLESTDKDMVVMMHEMSYTLNNKTHQVQSSLVVKGKNDVETAMAKTVGLPLAMSVCAYLKGELNITGLHIPINPIIYEPILKSLNQEGIYFEETELEASHS
jgi:saccharopine dehydrogenase (NADP+, L-glutamate forming)